MLITVITTVASSSQSLHHFKHARTCLYYHKPPSLSNVHLYQSDSLKPLFVFELHTFVVECLFKPHECQLPDFEIELLAYSRPF